MIRVFIAFKSLKSIVVATYLRPPECPPEEEDEWLLPEEWPPPE